MPKGLRRYYGAGDLHFITCSCHKRKPWLDTSERRDLFLSILEEVRKEHRFVVLGYVVMAEHFHLLMSEPQVGTPSTAMQSVKQRFAQAQAASSSGHPPLAIQPQGAGPRTKFRMGHAVPGLLIARRLGQRTADPCPATILNFRSQAGQGGLAYRATWGPRSTPPHLHRHAALLPMPRPLVVVPSFHRTTAS
jgi:REP element-mobilizing transposase RayT